MSNDNFENAFIVPIKVEALVVATDNQMYKTGPFDYSRIKRFLDPDTGKTTELIDDFKKGIYLQWQLPDALTHGKEKNDKLVFPFLPTRWIIIRRDQKNNSKAWVLKSDSLNQKPVEDKNSSHFYDLIDNKSQYIGDRLELAEFDFNTDRKSEFNPEMQAVLTALGVCDPEFLTHQENINNVFAFYDDVKDLADASLVDYVVLGWYGDAQKDVLNSYRDDYSATEKRFEKLDWLIPGIEKTPVDNELKTTDLEQIKKDNQKAVEDADAVENSCYYGSVHQVLWSRHDQKCQLIQQKTPKVNIAVADTVVDAMTALLKNQPDVKESFAELFSAFQYDYLDVLDQDNGQEKLEMLMDKARYVSFSGGVHWSIESYEGSENIELSQTQQQHETKLLRELNQMQRRYDQLTQRIESYQWLCYANWYKTKRLAQEKKDRLNPIPERPEIDRDLTQEKDHLDTQLNEAIDERTKLTEGKFQLLLDMFEKTKDLSEADAQSYFDDCLPTSSKELGLDGSRCVKYKSQSPYRLPNDPVVLISGLNNKDAQASAILEGSLPIRFSKDICRTAKTENKYQILQKFTSEAFKKTFAAASFPPLFLDLILEFYLICNSSNRTALIQQNKAAPLTVEIEYSNDIVDFSGLYPVSAPWQWQQPWQPRYMEWEIEWQELPMGATVQDGWNYNGKAFKYTGGKAIKPIKYFGRSPLAAHGTFLIKHRLNSFIEQMKEAGQGGDDNKGKDALQALVNEWSFMSQSLTGLHDQLCQRQLGYIFEPDNSNNMPQTDNVQSKPSLADRPFHGLRQGQMKFSKLFVYDQFGQVLEIVNNNIGAQDSQSFRPIAGPQYQRYQKKVTKGWENGLMMAPKVLSPLRLNAYFQPIQHQLQHGNAQADNEGKIEHIMGWLIANHVDKALDVYAPDGQSLGKLLLAVGGSDTGQTVVWQPSPELPAQSPYRELSTLGQLRPNLAKFLLSLQNLSEAAFQQYIYCIDATLWSIDPLGDRDDKTLSVLLGRPLAIMSAQFSFEIKGQARMPCHWDISYKQSGSSDNIAKKALQQSYAVALGRNEIRQDGLIGYYRGDDFSKFYSVSRPRETKNGYVKQIHQENYSELALQTENGEPDVLSLTLILDPRAAVFVDTGILPTKRLQINSQYVDRVIKAMKPIFRTGPILTRFYQEKVPEQAGAIQTWIESHIPPVDKAKWMWLRPLQAGTTEDKDYATFDIRSASDKAHFDGNPARLEEGFLQLNNINDSNED
jgi:hypothetical protein